jgi:hypothetical protein
MQHRRLLITAAAALAPLFATTSTATASPERFDTYLAVESYAFDATDIPPPPPVTVTPVNLPPGVSIDVVYTDDLPEWGAGWICAEEPQDDPTVEVAACGSADQIQADYPPPYWPAPY